MTYPSEVIGLTAIYKNDHMEWSSGHVSYRHSTADTVPGGTEVDTEKKMRQWTEWAISVGSERKAPHIKDTAGHQTQSTLASLPRGKRKDAGDSEAQLVHDVLAYLKQKAPARLVTLASGEGFAKRYNSLFHDGKRVNNGSWTTWLKSVPGVKVESDCRGRFKPTSSVTLSGHVAPLAIRDGKVDDQDAPSRTSRVPRARSGEDAASRSSKARENAQTVKRKKQWTKKESAE